MHEKNCYGLRILRQPMDEVLFVFLLSSVKSIPQIKEMKELVARKYGEPLELDHWSFPGWERLAEVSEEELRGLKMGYRAKYVNGVARQIVNTPSLLRDLVELPWQEAKSKLFGACSVSGRRWPTAVSSSALRTNAFPIDRVDFKDLGKALWIGRMEQ